MSKTIEERVLEMRFENNQFEQGIRESTKSLEMLRQALRFDDAANSLANIEGSVRGVDFSSMARNLDTVAHRFSTLGIIGDQVIRKITNGVIGLAGKIGTLIKQGGLTRAMNIEQAKFQLSGLGVAWDDISESINYAVKGTRYGLDEAAVAASQLVASGVQLGDQMSTSLRSISGVAAMTNREYSDIAQIFTTVASNGKLMTMQLRQLSYSGLNASAALAKELGKTEEQINEMVSKGEIDFQTFAAAMDNAFGEHATRANETFGGALANMKAALSRIGAEFWTPLMAGARDVINAITPVIDAIKGGLMPVFETFSEGVRIMSGRMVYWLNQIDLSSLREKVSMGLGKLKMSMFGGDTEITQFERIVSGLKALGSIAGKVIEALALAIGNLLTALAPLGHAFMTVGASIGDFLVWLNQSLEASDSLNVIFDGISSAVGSVVNILAKASDALAQFFEGISQHDAEGLGKIGDDAVKSIHPATAVMNGFKNACNALGDVVAGLSPAFERFGNFVKEVVTLLGKGISGGGLKTFLDTLNASVLTLAIAHFMDLGKGVDYLSTVFKRDIAPITSAFKTLRATFAAYQTAFNAQAIMRIGAGIMFLAIALKLLSTIPSDKIVSGLGAIGVIIGELYLAMTLLTKAIASTGFFKLSALTGLVVAFAASIAILGAVLKSLSELSMEEIGKGLLGIAGGMAVLVAGAVGLSKASIKITAMGLGLILLAASMAIMAQNIKTLSQLNMEEIGRGLLALAGSMTVLAIGARVISKTSPQLALTAVSILLLASSMIVMGKALTQLSALQLNEIGRGLLALGGILGELIIFTRLTSGAKGMVAMGAGMILVATSMQIFANALGKLGSLSLSEIGKSMLAMGGTLAEVSLAMRLMPKDSALKAVGLIAVAEAMTILSTALSSMGGMSIEEIGRSLFALGGAMGILAASLRLMSGAISGAVALGVVSVGISQLAPALATLAAIPIAGLITGLVAIAAALGILIGAAYLAAPVAPVIIALAAAFGLLGVGMLGISLGLTGIATALVALGSMGGATLEGLANAIKAVASTLPYVIEQIALGLVKLVTTIGEHADEIATAFGQILQGMLRVIGENGPLIIATFLGLIGNLLEQLSTKLPEFIDYGIDMIVRILQGIASRMSDLINAGVDVVLALMNGIAEAVPRLVNGGILAIIELINGMAAAIDDHSYELGAAAANLGIAIVNGVLKGLAGFANTIGAKLMEGARSAMAKVKSFLGIHSPSRVFRDEVGKQIVAGVALGATDKRGIIGEALVGSAETALHTLQKALKINSPSLVFKDEVGRWIAEGIAEGIEEDDTIEEALKKKADNIAQAFSDYINQQSIYSDIARLNWELWQQMYADEASTADFFKEYEKFLKEDLKYKERQAKAAADELKQTIEVFGESSQQAFEATKKMLEARKTYLEAQMTLANIDNEMYAELEQQATNQRNHINEIADKQADIAQAEYDLWVSMFPDATAYEKLEKQVQYLDGSIARQKDKVHRLAEELEWARERFGDASEEVLDAQAKYLKAQKDYFDLVNDRKTSITNYIEGGGLSQDQKDALSKAEQTIKEQESNLAEYELYLRDLAETNEKYGFGWSVDEMEAIARKRSGYNKEELDEARKVQKELQEIMEKGADLLGDTIEDKFSKIVDLFSKFGIKYADSMGNAFTTTVKKSVIPAMTAVMGVATGNLGQVLNGITNMIPKPDTNIQQKPNGSTSGGSSSITNTNPGKVDGSVWKPSTKPSGSGNNRPMIVANYNVTQNNTSPKALTSSTIYRQTSTLFAGMASAANKILSNKVSSMVKA